MEAGRLEQHINYLVKNLGYFSQDGRLQLLAVFQSLIEKLPGQLLESYTDLFFFTLFLRLVNDEN
jgi:U3 small nucleolar RNA-associated protein 20